MSFFVRYLYVILRVYIIGCFFDFFSWNLLRASNIGKCHGYEQEQNNNNHHRNKRKKYNKLVYTNEGQRMQALTINYPSNLFDGTSAKNDWRESASLNTYLAEYSSRDGSWKEISHAQDQEDIWLFETWFYGMEKGLIMESGALNGVLFSTSFMFEKYANWTALHVVPFSLL